MTLSLLHCHCCGSASCSGSSPPPQQQQLPSSADTATMCNACARSYAVHVQGHMVLHSACVWGMAAHRQYMYRLWCYSTVHVFRAWVDCSIRHLRCTSIDSQWFTENVSHMCDTESCTCTCMHTLSLAQSLADTMNLSRHVQ